MIELPILSRRFKSSGRKASPVEHFCSVEGHKYGYGWNLSFLYEVTKHCSTFGPKSDPLASFMSCLKKEKVQTCRALSCSAVTGKQMVPPLTPPPPHSAQLLVSNGKIKLFSSLISSTDCQLVGALKRKC